MYVVFFCKAGLFEVFEVSTALSYMSFWLGVCLKFGVWGLEKGAVGAYGRRGRYDCVARRR
jgi:hypothetical protein